jgi:cell wall-associated NlpC family hydrolase
VAVEISIEPTTERRTVRKDATATEASPGTEQDHLPHSAAAPALRNSVKEFRDAHAQPSSKAHEHTYARIALTTLDPPNIRKRQAAGVGYLLLGEAAFGADSEDVSAEAVEGIAGHGGIVVAWGRSALELISLATG